jgi:hypothetical protein
MSPLPLAMLIPFMFQNPTSKQTSSDTERSACCSAGNLVLKHAHEATCAFGRCSCLLWRGSLGLAVLGLLGISWLLGCVLGLLGRIGSILRSWWILGLPRIVPVFSGWVLRLSRLSREVSGFSGSSRWSHYRAVGLVEVAEVELLVEKLDCMQRMPVVDLAEVVGAELLEEELDCMECRQVAEAAVERTGWCQKGKQRPRCLPHRQSLHQLELEKL